jgi:hypothetical protein
MGELAHRTSNNFQAQSLKHPALSLATEQVVTKLYVELRRLPALSSRDRGGWAGIKSLFGTLVGGIYDWPDHRVERPKHRNHGFSHAAMPLTISAATAPVQG